MNELKKGNVCKNCGKTFKKKSYQQKFCCPKCKQKYWDRIRPDRHKDPFYYEKYNEEHGRYYEQDDWGIYSINDDPYYEGNC